MEEKGKSRQEGWGPSVTWGQPFNYEVNSELMDLPSSFAFHLDAFFFSRNSRLSFFVIISNNLSLQK